MKNYCKLLFFLTLSLNINIFGQNQKAIPVKKIGFCNTPAAISSINNSLINFVNPNLAIPLNNLSVCVKIYVHVIRNTNGTGGQTINSVNQAITVLNQDFLSKRIAFDWDGNIDYINNSTYYANPLAGYSYPTSQPTIFSINGHTNGIDIYLYDDSNTSYQGGLASGVGTDSAFLVSGRYWAPPYFSLTTSHVISHEMGHVLGLWHTHHGTINEGITSDPNYDFNQCPELVNTTNSASCGDYVTDTPADPYLNFNVNSSCIWQGNGFDTNGQLYIPSTNNIMAYTLPTCMTRFTLKQGNRMRSALYNLPHLQALSTYNTSIQPTGSPICITAGGGNVTIYPNPADSEIFIKSDSKNQFNFDYTIFDNSYSIQKIGQIDKENNKIDISQIKKGTYYLHLQNQNELLIKTIIINH